MKKTIIVTGITILMSVMLLACAGASQTAEEVSDTAGATAQEPEKEEKVLVTEEDYREAISSAKDDPEKLKLYREFSAGYKMNADEYTEYATLCEKDGDTISQRNALYALYRMDPSEAHGQLLSDMTLKITSKDDDKAEGLLKKVADELENCEADDFSPEAVKGVIASDDWKKSFHIDNGTFTSHTEFTGDEISALVDSDSLQTRAVITVGDKRYLCDISYNRIDVGHEQIKDGEPEGEYYYRQKDDAGVDIVSVKGYIKDGHYVNQLDIIVNSTLYSGSFDDSGKTKEEQPEGFKGVVYAYSEGKANYLYVENADAASFVANVGKMGFEEF